MSKRAHANAEQEPSFEQAVAELEELIEKIESGQVGLEECLTQYERGMKLIARCKAVLGAAQARIAELNIAADGSLRGQAGQDDDAIPGELSDDADEDASDDADPDHF